MFGGLFAVKRRKLPTSVDVASPVVYLGVFKLRFPERDYSSHLRRLKIAVFANA
jgi:hypothetical protein